MAPTSSVAGSTAASALAGGMKRSTLLKKCVEIIDSYDPKKTTVDAFIQDTPVLKDKSTGEIEAKFIHQVFYGCVRYGKFLRLFVTSFLYKCPTTAIRADQTLYIVLAYMLFFRLEELGVPEFRQFLSSGLGTHSGLLALLQYALSVEELEKWVKVEWCKVYDVAYIENDIIGKLQSLAPELRPVVAEVEFKATGAVTQQPDETIAPLRDVKRVTEVQPFNLTKPKPRLVPEPEVISRQVKALPVPTKMIHGTSLAEVEEEKKKRLEGEKTKIATKYNPEDHFELQTAKRRDSGSELEQLSRIVEEERMQNCTFAPKVNKYKGPPTAEAVVRQNTSAVLREDALLKQKQAKEYGILKRYEEDLHDASDYHRWQQEMKEKDQLDEEKRVQQRIIEMQLAREGAMEAQESAARKKAIVAQHHREELQIQLDEQKQELELELKGKQQLVEDTIAERGNAREATEEVAKARAEQAEKVRREKEAEFERKKREDEQEMERRKDLIRQIRALEKVPVERFKMFDRAEQPCQGLLEEMSYAELQERLKIVEAQHAKEVEHKRQRQLEKKVEKQEELKEKAETLAKIRDRAKDESRARHAAVKQRQKEVEEAKKRYSEQCTVEVAERIQQKKQARREEEQRLRRELKEISTKRQFLAANAEMVEAKAHAEQHAGLEREAKQRQKVTLHEQRRQNEIVARDKVMRRGVKAAEQESYRAMQEAVNERILRAKASDALLKTEIVRATQSARNSQKYIEHRLRDEVGHSANRYIQKVTQRMATSV